MKWIDPSRNKIKIIRCEFCGTDVSTPYKGIHDETELISGMPVKCRNNGRMNADIAYPKLAKASLEFNNIPSPKENIKWFVEDPETHLWWSGYKWTNDPLEAFGCDLKNTADRYARFQRIEKYIITEHEFLNSSALAANSN